MPEPGGQAISVARRAAARVGSAAGREHDPSGPQSSSGRDKPKALILAGKLLEGFFQGQLAAAAAEPLYQGGLHVHCPIGYREDLTPRLHLGAHALPFHQGDEIFRAESGQGGMEETSLAAEGLHDRAAVGRVREIAASAPGNEDLRSRASPLLKQERPPAALGRPGRGQQACGPGPHDNHFPTLCRIAWSHGQKSYHRPKPSFFSCRV